MGKGDAPPPIGADRVLVHIGPHKTGSTAVQMSLWEARRRLERAGTVYPVDSRHPRFAILAGVERSGLKGGRAPQQDEWAALCRRVAQTAERRVVLSSEIFANANADGISKVVADLGGDRVHIVVSLRALAQILPSQWQQHVHNSLGQGYVGWLDDVLRQPTSTAAAKFWRRHAHNQLIERWLSVVGADSLTVVVSDSARPRQLLTSFEALLALPAGTLGVPPQANRSLTLGEAELVRLINLEAARCGWEDEKFAELVRRTLCERLKERVLSPDDEPITTPAWATELANHRQEQILESITALGVTVHGDVTQLIAVPGQSVAEPGSEPLEAAIAVLTGMALRDAPTGGVDAASTRNLVRILGSRASRAARRGRN